MLRKLMRSCTQILAFLLVLPIVYSSVGIELGDALYNTDIIRSSDFERHSGGYSACVTDQVILPLRITNTNTYGELYTLRVDDANALLSSPQAALQSGQAGIITLTLPSNSFSAANATILVTVVSRREAVERNFAITLAYADCFAFSVDFLDAQPSYCACEEIAINGELVNEGARSDSYLVEFSNPAWLAASLSTPTVDLGAGSSTSFSLLGSIPCVGENSVSVNIVSTSGGSGLTDTLSKSYDVTPFSECYDTRIAAMDIFVDYSGTEVPVKISNKGLRAASYSLTLQGIPWYVASLDSFTLAAGQSRIITLYVQPDASIEEGVYDATILLQSDVFDAERDIQITVRERSQIGAKIQSYASFFRYYWILVVLIVALVVVLMRFRGVSKARDEKKSASSGPRKLFSITYFIFTALVLLGFVASIISFYLHRAGVETILPKPSSLVINILFGGLVLVVVLPFLTHMMSRGKPKSVVEKTAPKEVVVKKEAKKEPVARKKFSDWMLVGAVFVLIAVTIALFELLRANKIPALSEFFLVYYPYMIAGLVVLIILIYILVSADKRKKKKK